MIPAVPSPRSTTFGLGRWAVAYALRRWPTLACATGLLLLKVAADALRPWPILFLVDHVLQKRPMPGWAQSLLQFLPGPMNPAALCTWSVAATVLLFLLSWSLGAAHTYFSVSLGQRAVYDLASDLYAKLQRLSARFHASKSVGDNLRRVTADCGCVAVILRDAVLPVLSAVASLVIMAAVLWSVDRDLTLLSLGVVPGMMLVFRRYARPMLEASAAQQTVEARIYRVTEESLSAMPAVQAFTAEGWNDRRLAAANRETIFATLSLYRVQLRFKILIGLTMALGTAALLYFGARQAMQGQLGLGALMLFMTYLASFYEPMSSLSYAGVILEGAAGSARRVLEVLESEQDVKDCRNASTLKKLRGEVRLENVSFGYDPGRLVLRGVTLEVPAGQCVALAGPSGAGKSTLASLIPRFFDPVQGRVLLDGIDVAGVTLKSLRSQVAVVSQEPFLFPMTVAGNIAYGRPQATRAEIVAAAKAARADEFVRKLPHGYQTVLGDRGATLSLGQRQRLAIARALLKNAPILILDEPSSALDVETESALMEAIDALAGKSTVIIIAHRLSTLRRAGMVVLLQDGKAVRTAPPGDWLTSALGASTAPV